MQRVLWPRSIQKQEIDRVLISGQHGYLFAAASKNASTSVEGALAGVADISLTRPGMYKHLPVGAIRKRFAGFFDTVCPFEDFFSFGIIRDPVRRIISKFNYRSTFKPSHRNYCGDMSFDEFVEEMRSGNPLPPASVDLQAQFFGFDGTRPKVDCILRVESLASDAAALRDRMGLDLGASLGATRKNVNEIKRISFAEVSEDTMARITKFVRRDRALYDWTNKRHAEGWGAVIEKPKPAISAQQVIDFFRINSPEIYVESLTNKIRLTADLSTENRQSMLSEIRRLDPNRAERLGR